MSSQIHDKYIKSLKQKIPKEFSDKNQFITSVSQDIAYYLEEHPTADYEMLCLEFGTPEKLLHSFMDNHLDDIQITNIFSKQKKMRKIISALSAILIIFLFLWFIAIPNMAIKTTTTTTIIHTTESTEKGE